MKLAGNSLKWAAAVFAVTLALVLSGYYTGVLFSPANDTGKAHAESPYKGQEKTAGDDSNTYPSENLSRGETEKPRLTTGKRCSTEVVDAGSVNVLIIGEDKVSYLYDTLGIMSINKSNHTLKFIMIPRDTCIEYNDEINALLEKEGKSKLPGIFKINYTHHIGTMLKYEGKFNSGPISFLADVIKEKFGVEADDYLKVNTEGFVKVVNLFGGIDIKVPYVMNYDDPTQDLSIHLEKGMQHLNGRQAEGFVRFRQGWKEDGTYFEVGDTERKKNQINFLKAFVAQHGSLAEINKIPELFNILNKSIQTSIGVGDVLTTYTALARDIIADKYEIDSLNLEGKPIRINGSSYVDIE